MCDIMLRKSKKKLKGATGFTLIEVLVVVAIIGILAAIGYPTFLSMLPNIRTKAAARDIYADMNAAKMEAVKRNSCVVVTFDTGTQSYSTFLDDGAGVEVSCNGDKHDDEANLFSTVSMPRDVTLLPLTKDIGATDGVSFNSRGMITGSQTGNIVLQSGSVLQSSGTNRSLWVRVRVRPAGGVQLEVTGVGAPGAPTTDDDLWK